MPSTYPTRKRWLNGSNRQRPLFISNQRLAETRGRPCVGPLRWVYAAKVRRRYLLPGSCKAISGKQIALFDLPIRFFRDISSRDYSHIGEYARIVFCKGFRPLKAVTHHSAQILVPSSLTCGRSAPQNREP